jgi:hypothetical protein
MRPSWQLVDEFFCVKVAQKRTTENESDVDVGEA